MALRLKIGIILSTLFILFFGVPVASAQQQQKQNNSGKDDIVNPIDKNIVGNHTADGGCEYFGSMMLQSNEKAKMAEIVSQDPSSCAAVVREGIPKDVRPAKNYSPGVKSSSSSSVAYTGKSMGPDPESSGYLHYWLEDPVYLDVNSVTDYITWGWDGYNVVGNFYGSDYRWWLSEDGWYELTGCCHGFNMWWDGWGGAANVSTTDLFNVNNWIFGFNWVWYNPNRVEGGPQGQLWCYFYVTYGGDSSALLWPNVQLIRTM